MKRIRFFPTLIRCIMHRNILLMSKIDLFPWFFVKDFRRWKIKSRTSNNNPEGFWEKTEFLKVSHSGPLKNCKSVRWIYIKYFDRSGLQRPFFRGGFQREVFFRNGDFRGARPSELHIKNGFFHQLWFTAPFRIHLILMWIRIRILGSTFGKSGSGSSDPPFHNSGSGSGFGSEYFEYFSIMLISPRHWNKQPTT